MVCSSSFLSLLIVMLVYPPITVQDLCGNTEKVIDICSSKYVTSSPDEGSIILTVKTMNECHCLFFIDNQVNVSLINFIARLTPTDQKCKIPLTFEHAEGSESDIWNFQCKTNEQWNYPLPVKHRILIKTGLNGQHHFNENEAYCIDLNVKEILSEHESLHLDCTNDPSHTSTKYTTPHVSTGTKTSTFKPTTTETVTVTQETRTTSTKTSTVKPTTTETVTVTQETRTTNDNNSPLPSVIGGTIAGLVVLITAILIVLIVRRKRQNKHHRNPSSMNEEDDSTLGNDGLLYNVLYQPTACDTNANADYDHQQESQVNYVPVKYDGDYSAVDPDGFETPPTTNENELQKGSQKPKIAKKPTHLQRNPKQSEQSNEDKSVKHISVPGNDACEYAIVDKKNDIKRSERPSSTVNYTTASGDVYTAVQKSKTLPASSKLE